MAKAVTERPWKILLVSALEETRSEIEEILTDQGIAHQLSWVSQSVLALSRAQGMTPDVVLVDDEIDGANPTALIALLVARLPGTAVVVLVASDAMAKASQAVLAGARGFATKPLHGEELVSTLEQLVSSRAVQASEAQQEEPTNGQVIAFCAPKGGTGRTTLAINTAIGLQMATKSSVVLVDADYAAPALDVALNLHPDRNLVDILPRLDHLDEELLSGVLATHASGIQALLAPPPETATNMISPAGVEQIVGLLKRMFSWVVIDLGLPLDETAYAYLDGADRIVLSMQPEMVGLRNARLMLDRLHEQGYPEEKIWLVVNRATMRGGITVKDVEGRLHMQVHYQIPDDQPLATHSINLGVPVVVGYPRSVLAKSFRGFSEEVRRSAQQEAEPAPQKAASVRGGVLSRLFRRPSSASM